MYTGIPHVDESRQRSDWLTQSKILIINGKGKRSENLVIFTTGFI